MLRFLIVMSRANRWGAYLAAIIFIAALAFGYQLLKVRAAFTHLQSESEAPAPAVTLGAAGHRIAGRAFTRGAAPFDYPLVIVLHGDAPARNPGYQYSFAAKLADAVPGVRVIALMRPGYSDPYGLKSDGDRGFAAGETYTPAVIADVAAAIGLLESRWRTSTVILVGHSGGAAIAANIAALTPLRIEQLFLVGCPCDLQQFRKHMAQRMYDPLFWLPSKSLSPLVTLAHMPKRTTISAITGDNDPIALPEYAREYIAAARARDLSASLLSLPHVGHEILDDARVLDAVVAAVRQDARPLSSPTHD
jgi:pimeloyl-ACP methyl ester carboxylesterase